MKIILLGPPGAGKGTMAVRLAEKLSIPHISTGDIFRKNIREMTALGKEVKAYLDSGRLVPDEITLRIVEDRLAQPDCARGFLLDGFPRTLPQAEAFDERMSVDNVLNIDCTPETVVERLSSRRVCKACAAIYRKSELTSNVCAKCGGEIIQRDDDKEETILNRLKVYDAQTAPLIEYYGRSGKLVTIDGGRSVDTVFRSALAALGYE